MTDGIGKKISVLRKEKNLSQEELAGGLFVSRQTVSKWERGQSLPDADNIAAMCAFFKVSADELLGCGGPARETVRESAAEKRTQKRLWLKIVIITLVCFFAYLGLMAAAALIFVLMQETDTVVWTRVVPMIGVMLVIIFAVVLGIVIGFRKKNKTRK